MGETSTTQEKPLRRLLPISSFLREPEVATMQLSEGKVRWLIYRGEENGFGQCVVKKGGRVFIDFARFLRWLDLPSSEQ